MRKIQSVIALFGCMLMTLVLCECQQSDKRITYVNEQPKQGVFNLIQTKIDVKSVNFDDALYIDSMGYPRIDFTKVDYSDSISLIKTMDALIVENKYIKLTLLPGKGKPYSFVYKVTGHEQFFIPTVAQILGSPNKLGWWFVLGGVEYTLPADEHGDTWAAEWEWVIVEDSPAKKAVCMSVQDLRYGLEESITICIYPDKAYFQTEILIENNTEKNISFQHWINPMWAPGGRGEITPYTEFIIPTRDVIITNRKINDWMLDYHEKGDRIQPFSKSPLRFLAGWKSIGDLLASHLERGFYSAFSHEVDEGIVRVFPKEINPGCNIWAWGINPEPNTRFRFSGSRTSLGYVEMWGGITHGFEEYYTLKKNEKTSWIEWMYPFTRTKGLHFASKDFAVTFIKTDQSHCEVRLCPSGDIGNLEFKIVAVDTKELLSNIRFTSIFPKKDLPAYSIDTQGQDIELVILQDGAELIKLDASDPPHFPE